MRMREKARHICAVEYETSAASSMERNTTDEEEYEDLMLILAFWRLLKKLKKQQRRRYWVRPIFSRRKQQGCFWSLVQEMRLTDSQSHFRFFRMSKERFDILLHKVRRFTVAQTLWHAALH